MPELPEVEAARSAIADHCIGKKIIHAIIADDTKVIHDVTPSHFQASLLNKTIVAAHRKGKNLWLQLDSPPFPSFQFGMTGAMYIKGVAITKYKRSAVNDTDEWPSKFSKFFVKLDCGMELSFTDKRRFAKVRLLDDPACVPPISDLGPDALLEPMTEDEFYNSLNKKKNAIKIILLDQAFISGIGNWVADEVLYQARIHPAQDASSLSREDSARLLRAINEVIGEAVKVGADSNQYPSSWIFHSREKKHGKAFVDGKQIAFITVGSRTTAYVPELQKLSGHQATKAPTKPRKRASKNKDEDDDDDDGGNKHDSDGDVRESDSKEESINLKSVQVKNNKGGGKKPPREKTATKHDDVEKETRNGVGRAPAKRKSPKTGSNEDENLSKKTRGERKKVAKVKDDSDASDGNGDRKRPSKAKRCR